MRDAFGPAACLGLVAALSCGGCCPRPAAAEPRLKDEQPQRLAADEIMRLTAARYSRIQEYNDSGNIQFLESGQATVEECQFRFTTTFRRDGALSFRFRDRCPDLGGGLEHAQNHTRVWLDQRTGKKEEHEGDGKESLVGAIEELAGVSNGTSRYVPALLFGWDAFALNGPSTRLLGASVADCGFERCYVVAMSIDPHQRRTLTVDRGFLLRKMVVQFRSDAGAESTTVVEFHPLRIH